MRKLLTVVICAYNMEKYITDALESCRIKDMDKLEVLIMNDGSTDRTREICEKYCNDYPDVFILVNKENGGWGSNINLAVKKATGKYFRILDADDWFDTVELQKFIMVLSDRDESLVISRYRECIGNKLRNASHGIVKYQNGFHGCMNQLNDNITVGIWEVTIMTSLVKEYHINLPEKALFMDTLFAMQLLPYVHQIYFTALYVYNYRLNRKGQSNDVESLKKHFSDFLLTFDKQLMFYKTLETENNKCQVLNRLVVTYQGVVTKLLQISDVKEIHANQLIKEYDERLKRELPELYRNAATRKVVKIVRITNYHFCPIIKRLFDIYHIFFR